MNDLLSLPPYAERNDALLLASLNELTRHHLDGCPAYKRVWPNWTNAERLEDLPWLHVGMFKKMALQTTAPDVQFGRVLKSSATSSGVSSLIALDSKSSALQSANTVAILEDFVGKAQRPLLVLDSTRSLRTRGDMSARTAAALSLKPLASEFHFLLENADDATSMRWDTLDAVLDNHDALLVYGFTWILWLAWGTASMPDAIRRKLGDKQIHFVHSGGWKKLEENSVRREDFDSALLTNLSAASAVVDFYGLVEQVGIIYPMCSAGYRHPPVCADVIVRDPYTLQPVVGSAGLLQLLNILAYGAPYHSVLTEDIGQIDPGPCDCGRSGARFRLLGRIPKSEIRGCANV